MSDEEIKHAEELLAILEAPNEDGLFLGLTDAEIAALAIREALKRFRNEAACDARTA